MWKRISQLVVAELLAFGALVLGGLALLGGAVTWSGNSQHSALLSWLLVVAFASLATAFGCAAATRLRRVLVGQS